MRIIVFRFLLLGLIAGIALPLAVRAQPVQLTETSQKILVPAESNVLLNRLKFARKLAKLEEWTKAIESYERIISDAGDLLVPMNTPFDKLASSSRSLQVRRAIHRHISRLPPKVLKMYQQRVAAQTERIFDQADRELDREKLLRLVNKSFCAPAGDRALDALADLAFERGDFHQAQLWWQMIAPPPSRVAADAKEKAPLLRHPQPTVDVARVQAKIVFALFFDGDIHGAKTEFKAFKKMHGKASGYLAGQTGNYGQIIQKWFDKEPPDFGREKDWPAFAGSACRNHQITQMPHRRLWTDGPTWRVKLPRNSKKQADNNLAVVAPRSLEMRHYPVISGKRVLVADARSVCLHDLITGTKLDQFNSPANAAQAQEKKNGSSHSRFSVSINQDLVFALFGARQFHITTGDKRHQEQSHLTCLRLHGKNRDKLKKLWSRTARVEKADTVVFEATPLVNGPRVYTIRSSLRGFQAEKALLCYHARTGELLWETKIAVYPEYGEVDVHVVAEPSLTLADGELVCCTNAGLITSVDARTGKPSWAVRYPNRGPVTIEGTPSPRELGPCLYANGRLYAAPMDSDRILCLDPVTGVTLWERDRIQAVHVLGCRCGKLIFTTRRGIRAIDAETGADRWARPVVLSHRLPPRGRGFLAGGWVFWPTADGVFPLRIIHIDTGKQQNGQQFFTPRMVRNIAAGNMAFAGGCLVVATKSELIGYVAPRHLLKKKQPADNRKLPQTQHLLEKTDATSGFIDNAMTPTDVPDLEPPLQRQWRQLSGRILLPQMTPDTEMAPDAFYTTQNNAVSCRSAKTGRVIWRRTLPFAPSWLGLTGKIALAAGAEGVAAFHSSDGRLLWTRTTFGTGKHGKCLPVDVWRVSQNNFLTDFRLDSNGLMHVLQNGWRRLLLDAKTGEIQSVAWPIGIKLRPLGLFDEELAAFAPKTQRFRQTRVHWPTGTFWFGDVIRLNNNNVLCVANASTIYCCDREFAAKDNLWGYTPRLVSTLTGELPRIYYDKHNLLFLIARNCGYDLERIDPITGKNLWKPAARLCESAFGKESLAIDDTNVYSASGNVMYARALDDGRLLWHEKLPISSTGWRLRRTKQSLLIYTAPPPQPKLITLPSGRFHLPMPLNRQGTYRFAIQSHDPETGQLKQRLDFGLTRNGGRVQFFRDMLVVTAHSKAWGIRGKKGIIINNE